MKPLQADLKKLNKIEQEMRDKETLAQAYKRMMFDPYLWVKYMLGVDNIDPQQKEALDAVGRIWTAKYYKWKGYAMTPEIEVDLMKMGVSVRAGKGTGKDAVNAWLILWCLDCYAPMGVKVYVTAPGMDQITRDITWPEVSKWLNRRDENGNYYCKIRDRFDIQKEKITVKGYEKNAFCAPKVAAAQADDQAAAKTLAGLHEDYMLIIITEADGVREPVFNELASTMTRPMNMAIMAYNPTRNTGFAAQTHKDQIEGQKWALVHQNAEKSSIVTQEQIDNARKKGLNSNYYRVYVLGEFPLQEADCIIKWEWLINATIKDRFKVDDDYPEIAGIDPSGEGSDTTQIVVRKKNVLLDMKEITVGNTEFIGEKCLAYLNQNGVSDCICLANGAGADVFFYLRKYFKKVRGVYEMNTPNDPKRFKNKRAEMWYECARAFEDGLLEIPYDPELLAQLNAPRWVEGQKLLQVENKKIIKKKLGASPDKADAFVATFAKGFDYAGLIGPKDYRPDDSDKTTLSYMAA